MMSAKDLQDNFAQDYYNNQGVAEAIKKNLLSADNAHVMDYVEVQFPGQKTPVLCIKTPVTVENGPGRKYKAELL